MIEAQGAETAELRFEPVPRTCDEQDRCEGAGVRSRALSFDHPDGRPYGLYALRSLHLPALDAGGPELLTRFDNHLDSEDPFAETADDMSFYLHADGGFLKLDGDGRITVTDFMREHTGISSDVTFAGANTHFQMWHPDRFEAHRAKVRQRLAEKRRQENLTAGKN